MIHSKSLKPLLIRIFLFGPTLLIICLILLSSHSINALMTNKIELIIENNLSQFISSIDSSVKELNQAAYQFTEGSIGEALILLPYATPYEKTQLSSLIREQIELISFTYNDFRVISFYRMDEKESLFSNKQMNQELSLDSFPTLMQKNQFLYFAPHKSIDQYAYNDTPVLSLLKRMGNPDMPDIYLYLESNFDYHTPEQRSGIFGEKDFFLITDTSGNVLFSEVESVYPVGSAMDNLSSSASYYLYWQDTPSFSVCYFVPKAEYNREKYTWFFQAALLLLLYTVFILISFLGLWRKILKPIRQTEEAIKAIRIGDLVTAPRFTGVLEFDHLIEEIYCMKQELSALIAQTREQEAKQARLEIEKLMYQINPHFLMNSLNTLYWMARLNHQPQIGKYISALNKLLQYNLKHEQAMVPLQEEIDALKQYILLQKLRYDFHYHFICKTDSLKNFPVPRFILQPLVENSISHGLREENSLITITIRECNGLEIEICDNGYGMSPQTVQALMASQDSFSYTHEMGIGLNYVIKILKNRYGSSASLQIESIPQEGTRIYMHIPGSLECHQKNGD